MRVVFLGPPGRRQRNAGATACSERFGVEQISTGDILRDNLARGTEARQSRPKATCSAASSFPTRSIIEMIERELERRARSALSWTAFRAPSRRRRRSTRCSRASGWPLDAAVLFDGRSLDAGRRVWRRAGRTRATDARTTRLRIRRRSRASTTKTAARSCSAKTIDAETVAKRLDVYDRADAAAHRVLPQGRASSSTVDALASVKAVADRIAAGDRRGARALATDGYA